MFLIKWISPQRALLPEPGTSLAWSDGDSMAARFHNPLETAVYTHVAISPVQLEFSSCPSCFSSPGDSSGVSNVPSESELWEQQKTFTDRGQSELIRVIDCSDFPLSILKELKEQEEEKTSCFYFRGRGRERRGSREYKATCILWPSIKTHTCTHTHSLLDNCAWIFKADLLQKREVYVCVPIPLNTHETNRSSQWWPQRLPSLMIT